MNNYNVNQNGNLTKPAEVDWLKKAEYASAAAMQGLSLGFADEIEGVAGGVGYALASLLNPNEKVWDAARRGYVKYRDERRAMLEEGKRNAPGLMNNMEFISSLASPIPTKFFSPVSRIAPMSVKAAVQARDAVIGGSLSGWGKASGDFYNQLWETTKGTASGFVGNKLVSKIPVEIMSLPLSPAARDIVRRVADDLGVKLSSKFMDNIEY